MKCSLGLRRIFGSHSYDVVVSVPGGSHFKQGFYSPFDFSFFTLIGRR